MSDSVIQMSDSLAVSYSRNATKTLSPNSSNVVASLYSCKVCNKLKKLKSRTFESGLIAGWYLKHLYTFYSLLVRPCWLERDGDYYYLTE